MIIYIYLVNNIVRINDIIIIGIIENGLFNLRVVYMANTQFDQIKCCLICNVTIVHM